MSEILCTHWNFKTDQMHPYAFWNNFLSKKECDTIVKQGRKLKLHKAKTNSLTAQNARKSNTSWIFPKKDNLWLFRRTTDVILDLNNKYFNFDISGLNEGFQFTNYKHPDGHYGKHVDNSFNRLIRKLSVSIQLTDPKKYEGGDLKLYTSEEGKIMDRTQGTLIIFPSFTMHEVLPITKGERNSLVSWITGKPFK